MLRNTSSKTRRTGDRLIFNSTLIHENISIDEFHFILTVSLFIVFLIYSFIHYFIYLFINQFLYLLIYFITFFKGLCVL